LALLARKYLQIPATSAPSERLFSLGALIINKLRNRISKETFEEIISLKSWGILLDEDKEIDEEGERDLERDIQENEFYIPIIED
jgi:hypothetical protein